MRFSVSIFPDRGVTLIQDSPVWTEKSKGEFISFGDSFYFVKSISGNKFHLVDLSNWKKQFVDEKEIHKAKLLGGKELIQEMIFVSQTEDEVQAMDPDTYKISIIKKPKPVELKSEKISVVKIEDKYFLFKS